MSKRRFSRSVGVLDKVDAMQISGWVSAPHDHIIVKIKRGGTIKVGATLPRVDLTAAGLKGAGFSYRLPELELGQTISVLDPDGHELIGSPSQMAPNRSHPAVRHISYGAKILEVGPGYNPLVGKAAGWNSLTVDHATQEGLREKYGDTQYVNVDNIPPIDFVWTSGPLIKSIPSEHHGTFDAIVASHVMEHFPDPLGFLKAASELLASDGLLSLVLPDKRYMFDLFQFPSTTAEFLQAHYEKRDRHIPRTHFNSTAYCVETNGTISWGRHVSAKPQMQYPKPLAAAMDAFNHSACSEEYVDMHATYYTAESFQLLIFELAQLGQIDFDIIDMPTPQGCEFYATLRKSKVEILEPEAQSARRIGMLQAMMDSIMP